MDSGADTVVGDDMSLHEPPQEKRARTDTGSENPQGPPPPWASLHADPLGVVLRFLPCLADRARMRSVCRQWRAATRGRGGVAPPPLPLLVCPTLKFSSLTPGGVLTDMRSTWMPLEMRIAAAAVPLGSSGDWIVGAPHASGGECFMVNAFSHVVLHAPRLGGSADCSLHKVVLSASPSSRPDYTMAAYMVRGARTELALWKPGMRTWRFCHHALFAGHVDIAFYLKKLYMLWRFTPCLFVLELGEDDDGVMITSMKDCLVEKLLPSTLMSTHEMSLNMAEWRKRLLLIVRYYACYRNRKNKLVKIEVFVMDLSTMPCGLTQIHNFDTDCVFVGAGGCGKSFPAGLHAGVEGDLIYFGPDHYNPNGAFAYNMRDHRKRPIVEPKPLPCGVSLPPRRNLGFPVWLFPSE